MSRKPLLVFQVACMRAVTYTRADLRIVNRNGRVKAKPQPKSKALHRRDAEFTESEYFLIKNSLLSVLRASAVSSLLHALRR
jgi:hypothetical protein